MACGIFTKAREAARGARESKLPARAQPGQRQENVSRSIPLRVLQLQKPVIRICEIRASRLSPHSEKSPTLNSDTKKMVSAFVEDEIFFVL